MRGYLARTVILIKIILYIIGQLDREKKTEGKRRNKALGKSKVWTTINEALIHIHIVADFVIEILQQFQTGTESMYVNSRERGERKRTLSAYYKK